MAIPTGRITLVRQDTNQAFFQTNLDANGNYNVPGYTGLTTMVSSGIPVVAQYSGDANYAPSTSPVVVDVIVTPLQATQTSLSISPNPANVGDAQTFSGSVTAA